MRNVMYDFVCIHVRFFTQLHTILCIIVQKRYIIQEYVRSCSYVTIPHREPKHGTVLVRQARSHDPMIFSWNTPMATAEFFPLCRQLKVHSTSRWVLTLTGGDVFARVRRLY